MNRKELINTSELKDERTVHKEVDAISAVYSNALVFDGKRPLELEGDSG